MIKVQAAVYQSYEYKYKAGFQIVTREGKIDRILFIFNPFKNQFNGEVGIGIDADWAEPAIWSRNEDIRNQIQKPVEGLPKFTDDEKTKNRGSCDFIRIGFK